MAVNYYKNLWFVRILLTVCSYDTLKNRRYTFRIKIYSVFFEKNPPTRIIHVQCKLVAFDVIGSCTEKNYRCVVGII